MLFGFEPISNSFSSACYIILQTFAFVSWRNDSSTSSWVLYNLPFMILLSRFLLKWFFTTEKQPSIGLYCGEYGTLMMVSIFIRCSLSVIPLSLWYDAPSMNRANGYLSSLWYTCRTCCSKLWLFKDSWYVFMYIKPLSAEMNAIAHMAFIFNLLSSILISWCLMAWLV